MGRVFTVSSRRIFTPNNLKGSAGSDWASHEIIGGKAQSQWVGPKLKSYTMDILLRAQDGVSPRATLNFFQRVLLKNGVIDKLREAGVKEGDTVNIYDFEFEFVY